ncbi:hypothetical protein DFH09DRAFT_1076532 [Mycena vulgaris]|nr:hypothetical protein DFH09DRAFT_1076532 [Mycena vulgaris]
MYEIGYPIPKPPIVLDRYTPRIMTSTLNASFVGPLEHRELVTPGINFALTREQFEAKLLADYPVGPAFNPELGGVVVRLETTRTDTMGIVIPPSSPHSGLDGFLNTCVCNKDGSHITVQGILRCIHKELHAISTPYNNCRYAYINSGDVQRRLEISRDPDHRARRIDSLQGETVFSGLSFTGEQRTVPMGVYEGEDLWVWKLHLL